MDKWNELESKLIEKLNLFEGDGLGNIAYKGGSLEDVRQDIQKLHLESVKDNYVWKYCGYSVYKNSVKDRFEKYKSDFPDAEPKDFAEEEIRKIELKAIPNAYISDNGQTKVSDNHSYEYLYCGHKLKNICNKETFKKIEFAQKKKKNFLDDLLANNVFDTSDSSEHVEDFSDSKSIEKFVMLYKLGFFDFLNEKLPRTTSQATKGALISSITGIKSDTARRYINDIATYNNNTNSIPKNYPLKKKNLDKVKAKLTELGLEDVFYKK